MYSRDCNRVQGKRSTNALIPDSFSAGDPDYPSALGHGPTLLSMHGERPLWPIAMHTSCRPCENTASGRGGGNEVLGEFTEPGKFGL
jgi:hypothetical protein